ncbi:hypothetical protein [Leptothrix ochracea]|uniref:hypothetical protein n=1 Tax=Leptothrix ochracea TaxID=735331 RepID=UPI0034E1D206
MKYSIIGVLIASLFTTGCAIFEPAKPVSLDQLKYLKKISVISVAADKFDRQYVGLTVFNNELESLNTKSFGLNEEYESQLGAAVEVVLGAKYQKVPYSRDKIMMIYKKSSLFDTHYDSVYPSMINDEIGHVCRGNGLDGVFVLFKQKFLDPISGTNQSIEGAGYYTRFSASYLHLIFGVALFDCATAKPVAIGTLEGDQPGKKLNIRPVSKDLALKPLKQWTEKDIDMTRSLLISAPKAFWGGTLKRMYPYKD